MSACLLLPSLWFHSTCEHLLCVTWPAAPSCRESFFFFWLLFTVSGKIAGSSDSNLVSGVRSAGLGQGHLETKQVQSSLIQKWNLFELLFPLLPTTSGCCDEAAKPHISVWARPIEFWAFGKLQLEGQEWASEDHLGKHSFLILEIKKKKIKASNKLNTRRNLVGGQAGMGVFWLLGQWSFWHETLLTKWSWAKGLKFYNCRQAFLTEKEVYIYFPMLARI